MMGRMGSGTVVALMMTVALLFVVAGFIPVSEGAKETAAEHKVRARDAVRGKYVEWLNHWGAKHEAKQQAAALRSAQVDVGTAAAAGGRGELENQLSATSSPGASKVIVVDKSGKGDVTTVQAAVDRVPKHNDQRIEIQINAGTYE
jgi:pectin methylesterase-like acyl-CoA thioesterase